MLALKGLRIIWYSRERLAHFHIDVKTPKGHLAPCQVDLGPLHCVIRRVPLVFPQVWNWTEPEPIGTHLLNVCFLKTAGIWVPPMYLWVLGPIYLLYIHRHSSGYLRMSLLFKAKLVTAAPGTL